jgi:hypothetical protein
MSKRFTDTDKYKKPFIRSLPGAYKVLWDLINLECNYAGIWHVDFQVAQIYLGPDLLVNEADALKYFNQGQVRVEVLDGGSKWFIRSFVDFQYGKLNPENRVHSSIINTLSTYQNKPLTSPLVGAKDKDKDIDGVVVRDGVEGVKFDFEPVWQMYPKRVFKKHAARYFASSVKTEQDYADIQQAITNYLQSDTVKNGYVQNGSTWFNNWRDWVDAPINAKANEKTPSWM